MKKKAVFLLFFLVSCFSMGFDVKVIHSPEIKSRFNGVVLVPSKTTPYEFTGYIEEKIKGNTKLEVIKREVFSDFLKREGIGQRKITEKDLIKIYKAFGNINIIFLDLKNLEVKKQDLKGKTPCKIGNILFSISVFHSRDGIVLKNREIEFNVKVCSKTPLYPDTSEVIKVLFKNSANEVIKTLWPWKETLKFPNITEKICKNGEILKEIAENNLKIAEKELEKNNGCYKKNPYEFNLLKGYLLFFKGDFKNAVSYLQKATNEKKSDTLTALIKRIRGIDKKTIAAISIIKEKNIKPPVQNTQLRQKYYAEEYKNSGDILLEKLNKLEKLYKSGKISKDQFIKAKYKLIEEF